MRILFLAKRHYTNQDAFADRFGRIRWLPLLWHRAEHTVQLVLVDYHGYRNETSVDEEMAITVLPAASPASLFHLSSIAKRLQPSIVIASGDCFVGLIGQRLARNIGAKFVLDVYDDYRTFRAYRAFLGWDALGFLSRRADLIMYASRTIAEKHGFDAASIVVPNGVDGSEFRPMVMSRVRQQLRLPESGHLIGYFGSMTAEHGVNVLVRALHKLRIRHPDLQLVICGKQDDSTPVDQEGILYRGMVPHSMIPRYLNACDVLALPYGRGAFIDSASSCKIAEYLMCRRPIVATRTPNFVENFPAQAKHLDALLVQPGDPDALARSIERQLNDPVVVEPPDGMYWPEIAERLRESLQRLLG